jgi:hypothetical protein
MSQILNHTTFRRFIKLQLVALSMLLVCSCTRYEKPEPTDRFQKIQQKISDHKEEDAEIELEEILKQDPENQRARVILASIFIQRAGISIRDYLDLEKVARPGEEKPHATIDLEKIDQLKIEEKSKLGQAVNFLNDVNTASILLQEIGEKFNRLPVVTEASSNEIWKALQELDKIKEPTAGNALYRGVIKLFYFKYLLANQKFLAIGHGQFCALKLHQLQSKLKIFASYTVGMIRDLGRGYPKKQADLELQAASIQSQFQKADVWLSEQKKSELSVAEIFSDLAKAQAIEGVKCEF